MPTAETQEMCIIYAYDALKDGGKIYIDNGNSKKKLTMDEVGESWIAIEGIGADGTYGRWTGEVIDVDVAKQIMYIKREWYTRTDDGKEKILQYIGSKHPVGYQEVHDWLIKYCFRILNMFADRFGNPFTPDSNSAILFAEKVECDEEK